MTRLFAVIPALNEAPNLARLIADLASCAASLGPVVELRAVIVDDGSSDGTSSLARSLAAQHGLLLDVVRHQTPLGPGKAFHDGFELLASLVRDQDVVLTLEADNTSRLDLVGTMLAHRSNGAAVVFASPYMEGGGIIHTSLWRVLLSRAANTFVKRGLGLKGIHTVSSFYRLYDGRTLRRLQATYGAGVIERAGFECMVEVAMKLRYLGLSIVEVPMVLDTSQRIGVSRMRVARTARGYLALFRERRRWHTAADLAPHTPTPETAVSVDFGAHDTPSSATPLRH
jgi:dolichol-phosphate mannosyltransferase